MRFQVAKGEQFAFDNQICVVAATEKLLFTAFFLFSLESLFKTQGLIFCNRHQSFITPTHSFDQEWGSAVDVNDI